MKESVTYQAILEEGEVIGEAKGKVEGALAEAKKWLQLIGEQRFGPPDEAARAALESVGEVQRLEELRERSFQVSSWQELLGLPAKRRLPRRQ